jgi:hypothetical protein
MKSSTPSTLEAFNAQDQPVIIQMIRKTGSVTDIQITVGTFDSVANRTEAQQIHDKMNARF